MSKITQVEPQKRNLRRFNIYLDGQFVFGANEDLVVEHRLVVGKEIPQEQLEKLLFEAEVGKLMERMYRLFNIRQRSEKEVRDYLRELNYKRKVKGQEEISPPASEFLINKLKQKDLLNDLVFAKAWVGARRSSKKKGLIALKSELFQKGIDKEIIEQVLGENGESEKDIAIQALGEKLQVWQDLPYLGFKKKAYEHLARKGFEYSIIKDVVENVIKER